MSFSFSWSASHICRPPISNILWYHLWKLKKLHTKDVWKKKLQKTGFLLNYQCVYMHWAMVIGRFSYFTGPSLCQSTGTERTSVYWQKLVGLTMVVKSLLLACYWLPTVEQWKHGQTDLYVSYTCYTFKCLKTMQLMLHFNYAAVFQPKPGTETVGHCFITGFQKVRMNV